MNHNETTNTPKYECALMGGTVCNHEHTPGTAHERELLELVRVWAPEFTQQAEVFITEIKTAERRAADQEWQKRLETLRATADRATARADAEYQRGRVETVKRIRERLQAQNPHEGDPWVNFDDAVAILDEETTR